MSVRYTVIEYKVWKRDDGATASPYGACPWTSDAEEKRWTLVTRGWTVRDNVRGTVGICKPPWKTKEEAEAWVVETERKEAERRAAWEAARARVTT